MKTGTAYKDIDGKYVARIELHHPVHPGRSSGGTSYYYKVVRVDAWIQKFFREAAAWTATGGRWRHRKLDRAVILAPELAALFPHELLGLTAVEAPL